MTTHSRQNSAASPAPGSATSEALQDAAVDLAQQVELAGYYPELVLDTLRLASGEEEIISGMVQAETTFAEAVHRHLTVLSLTSTRLIIVHVDDAPRDDGSPGALATSEAVPLSRIRSMALTRGVSDPAQGGGTLTEMTIAVSWGSVRRIDMEPATCGDPDCQADHGMTGVSVPDDVVIRVAAGVEGAAALARADLVAVLVRVLLDRARGSPAHQRRAYELSGPAALRLAEVAERLAIGYEATAPTDVLQEVWASGQLALPTPTLATLLGRPPQPLAETLATLGGGAGQD